jgi:hypothetical protein
MNNDLNKEIKSRTFGYISGALGLVAGLAWNDAITNMIETIFPLSKDTMAVKFFYAILITIVVVMLVKYLERMINANPPQ